MIGACKDACDLASWPMRDRIDALKRIIPRRKVKEVLKECGVQDRGCRRLPGWFLVWFVVALGPFCRDSYRQVFRWLSPYRRRGTPGRKDALRSTAASGCCRLAAVVRRGRGIAGQAGDSGSLLSRDAADGHRRVCGRSSGHRKERTGLRATRKRSCSRCVSSGTCVVAVRNGKPRLVAFAHQADRSW